MSVDSLIVVLLLCVFGLLLYVLHKLHIMQNQLGEAHRQMKNMVHDQAQGLFVQLEAYLSLRDKLNLHQGLPYTPYWSASPDFLKIITEHCLEYKPQHIVECSSGLSSLILARCCESNQQGQVFSLENGEDYARKTRQELECYSLQSYATVFHAPLLTQMINGEDYLWYSLDELPEQSIDMLVIDGPPGYIQSLSRYPALPLLFDKLADQCMVFMDDAARDDEKKIVERWLSEFPGIEHQYIKTERGCSMLRISKTDR